MLSQFLSCKRPGAAFLHAAPCAFMFAPYADPAREDSMAKDRLFWSKPEIK